MKLLMKIILVVLAILLIAGLGTAFYADRLADAAIERGGNYALGVETNVGSADLGVLAGRIALDDVVIENPEGFTSDHFLRFDEGSAEVDVRTLMKDIVEVPSLSFTGLDMNLESEGGRTNHQVILENIRSREQQQEPAEESKGKGYVIRDLVLEDVKVHADLLPSGGKLTQITIPVEEIHLTDVGTESDGGVLLWELSSVMVKAILAAVLERQTDLPAEVLAGLKENLGELEELRALDMEITTEIGKAVRKVSEAAEQGVREGQEALEELGDVLEGESGSEPPKKGKEPEKKPDPRGR
jgi:hypothetical protein